MNPEVDLSGRRKWLARLVGAAMTATVATISYPIAMFMRPRRREADTGVEVVAPYRVDQLVVDADGNWPGPFEFGGKPCLLIKTADGSIKAFNAVCTHLDCTVSYRLDKGDIFCNCHNGVFSLDGNNVSGPPPKPLQEYNVTLRGEPGREEIIVSAG